MKIRDYVFYISVAGCIAAAGISVYGIYHLSKKTQETKQLLLHKENIIDKLKKETKEQKSRLEKSLECN